MGFERALIDEIANLERELERDTRFQRWRALCAARDLYPPEAAPAASRTEVIPSSEYRARYQVALAPPGKRHPAPRKGGRKRGPDRAHALDLIIDLLAGRSGLTSIDAIHRHLTERGVAIGGQNPKNNLSSMLYKDERFRSHGRSGWELSTRTRRSPAPDESGALDRPRSNAEAAGSPAAAGRLPGVFD